MPEVIKRRPSSLAAEAAFRARLQELGAELLDLDWRGNAHRYHARCAAGHDCYPMPNSVQQGRGICRTCSGLDPVAAEAAFRARLAELGAELLGPYINSQTPHHVRCAAGHDCYPRPSSLAQGQRGICRACAGHDPAMAEAAFRARLDELGAEPLYERYLGSGRGHRVRCAAGHICHPRPGDVRQGDGVCRTCAGKDPAVAESAFLARLAELGAVPLYEQWRGVNEPHYVRCPAGHDCYPRPGGVRDGAGICRPCSGFDPAACEAKFRERLREIGAVPLFETYLGAMITHPVRCAAGHIGRGRPSDVLQGHGVCRTCSHGDWDIFYVVASPESVKFGITSSRSRGRRLRVHAREGYAEVIRLATGLPGTAALDAEDAVKAALAAAGKEPLRGWEYFDRSCLPFILDVADSLLAVEPTRESLTIAS